jgi:hypothetical protein
VDKVIKKNTVSVSQYQYPELICCCRSPDEYYERALKYFEKNYSKKTA